MEFEFRATRGRPVIGDYVRESVAGDGHYFPLHLTGFVKSTIVELCGVAENLAPSGPRKAAATSIANMACFEHESVSPK
jgi:hypothetical protein